MKAPPIRLLEQHYKRILVEAVDDHSPGDNPGWRLSTTISVRRHPENKLTWAVLLKVAIDQEEGQPVIPYKIAADVTGIFEVHPGLGPNEVMKMVGINGVSILYSGLRDFIATITARGSWGVFLLPTVSFADMEFEPPEPEEHTSETP